MCKSLELINQDGEIKVSSRVVAFDFGKEHFNLTRTIENLTLQNSRVKNMFIESTYNHNGNQYKEYFMNRDGFSLLVMGFTGSEALEWKIKYIEAFNIMEKSLKENENLPINLDNFKNEISSLIDSKVDSKIKELESYYKPTHLNKIHISNYIKQRLGVQIAENNYELVKKRILILLGATKWQDVPYELLRDNINLIDECINEIKKDSPQISMFD